MKNRDAIAWGIVFLVVIGGLSYMYIDSRPTAAEVTAAVRPINAAGVAKLDEATFGALGDRQTNGAIPVNPSPANPPRTDPFSR